MDLNRRTGVTEDTNEGYGLKTLSRLSRFVINVPTIKAADNLFPSRRSFFIVKFHTLLILLRSLLRRAEFPGTCAADRLSLY